MHARPTAIDWRYFFKEGGFSVVWTNECDAHRPVRLVPHQGSGQLLIPRPVQRIEWHSKHNQSFFPGIGKIVMGKDGASWQPESLH